MENECGSAQGWWQERGWDPIAASSNHQTKYQSQRKWDEDMKDTFYADAEPAEPLGPQPSKERMQGQLPPFGAFLKRSSVARTTKQWRKEITRRSVEAHKKRQRSASHTQGVPTNTERRSQPRGVLHITYCTHRQMQQQARMQV